MIVIVYEANTPTYNAKKGNFRLSCIYFKVMSSMPYFIMSVFLNYQNGKIESQFVMVPM